MADREEPYIRNAREPVPTRTASEHDVITGLLSETTHCARESTTHNSPSADNVKLWSRHDNLRSSAKEVPIATHFPVPDHAKIEHELKTTKNRTRSPTRFFLSWTDPLSLIMFCVLFALVLATLVLLSQLSRSRNGFKIPLNVSPYTWKYGPTAIITIIVALWRQVDRQTKMDQPWIELSATSAPAYKSLMLDYTSPILPVALWASLRNKHWRVAIVATVFALLKVAVIFSTSLIVVHAATPIIHQAPLMLQRPYAGPDPTSNVAFYLNQIYGNLVNGLEYPSGISPNAAFQVLSAANQLPSNATVTAEVMAAFPEFLCEPAYLTANFMTTDGYVDGVGGQPENRTVTSLKVSFSSTHCYGEITPVASFYTTCDIRTGLGCTSDVYYVTTEQAVDCIAYQGRPNYVNATNAFVFALLALSPPAQPNGSFVRWSSGALCKSNYVVEKASLTGSTNGIGLTNAFALSGPLTSAGDTLPHYAPSNITNEIELSLLDGVYETKSTPASSSTANYEDVEVYFNLMLAEAGTSNIETFRNYSAMVASASRVYQRFAAYLLARQLALPDNLSTQGLYKSSETRLFVSDSSVWIVMAIVGVAIAFTLGLVLINARQRTVHSPSTLSHLSACIARGSDAFKLLNDTGRMSIAQMSDRLSEHIFSAVPVSEQHTQLQTRPLKPNEVQKIDENTHETGRHGFWVPFSARRVFIALCIVIPAVEIVVLEVLQRKSDANQGFSDTHASFYASENIATLGPAVIMVSTAALYSASEWSIGVFAPFSLAKKRPVSLKRINQNSADALAPIAILRTLMQRQYGASFIILASILGSFLTIISSGLYSLQAVPRPLRVSFSTTTQFDTTWDQATAMSASNLFSLIVSHNASYPDGTFEELAYPLMQLNEVTGEVPKAINNATFVDIDVPVLRAHLDCMVPSRNRTFYGMNYAQSSYNITIPEVQFNVTMDLPNGCQHSSGNYRNMTQLTVSSDIQVPSPFLGSEDLAEILYVEGFDPNRTGSWNETSFPPYCPGIAFTVGRFSNDTSIENKTVLVCTQLQQEIPASLRFSLPDLSLDTSTRPKLDESRAKVVSGHQYAFDSIFIDKVEAVSAPSAGFSDAFYQTMVNMTGISINSMIGPDNEAVFYNQTERLYRLFMAQLFSAVMREKNPPRSSVNATLDTLPAYAQLNGTIYDNEHLRVVQHRTSKLVLQILLGIMMLCAATAFSMVTTNATLPHNPCSIAGKLSLLVGGHFADECADIAELCDDPEEPGRRLQDSKVKLGWHKIDRASNDRTSPSRRWFGLDFHHENFHPNVTFIACPIRLPLDSSVDHSDCEQ